MKFCYVDESGTGEEPYAVMVGVLVDASRMRPTKADWDGLLRDLEAIVKSPVAEIHTRDFYAGNGPWRGIDGPQRADIISAVMSWIADRKHAIVFASVDKARFNSEFRADPRWGDVKTLWRFLGLHLSLAIQKQFQSTKKNKGNTVLIFDNEETERTRFTDLLLNPPDWTDTYYNRGSGQERLDQIVDAPYFADSRAVPLLQVADLVAYFLRRFVELEAGARERYAGEHQQVGLWAELALERATVSNIYPKRSRCECAQLFCDFAAPAFLS